MIFRNVTVEAFEDGLKHVSRSNYLASSDS